MNPEPSTDRYARQIRFAPVGKEGQKRIADSVVAILGCGALGTVAAEILVRAGVGQIRVIDRDVVEWTNLQRQSLFDEQDATEARAKAEAATNRLSKINSTIEIQPLVVDVTKDNIDSILGGADLVIDAVDNFAVRFLLNDWSLKTETAWVHGGCIGASGQVMLFTGKGSPCFRCIVPEPPPAAAVDTCDTAGVIGAATHMIASLQAAEAIKWLSGNRDDVCKQLTSIDLWQNRIRQLKFGNKLSDQCKACGEHKYEYLDGMGDAVPEQTLCGRDAVQISRVTKHKIDLDAIAARWDGVGRVQSTRFFVRLFPDDQFSLTLFRDGRTVVTGTSEIAEARMLYDRYVGG